MGSIVAKLRTHRGDNGGDGTLTFEGRAKGIGGNLK